MASRKKYLQLTYEDRRLLSHWKARGLSVSQIAGRINVHKSTVSRELRRNAHGDTWTAQSAQYSKDFRTYLANQKRRRKRPQTRAWVIGKLKDHWSPKQIAGRSRLEAPQPVSFEYVYRLVYEDRKKGGRLFHLLKRFGKRKQRFNSRSYPAGPIIPGRVGIEERPAVVEKRERLGDLEGDLIQGYCASGYILSVVDRKSRFITLRKLRTKHKRLVLVQLERALRKQQHARTLTLDNGTEFCGPQELTTRTGVPVYFAHPCCSTDKGSIENANGLVRYFLPKKTCFKKLTQARLNEIQDLLNHRPRACLGYLTPAEVHFKSRPQISPSAGRCTSDLTPPNAG